MRRHLKFAHAANEALIVPTPEPYGSPARRVVHDAFRSNVILARSLLILPGYAFLAGRSETGEYQVTWSDPYAQLNQAAQHFEMFAEDNWEPIYNAVEHTLASVIIQMWTAFEVLCEDLYKCANAEAKSALPRPVHHRTGQIMQPKFRSRDNIRISYTAGFALDGGDILNSLSDLSIDALSLLRNVIVHKAGKADDKFRDWTPKIPLLSLYANLKDGDPVLFDGETVDRIAGHVIGGAQRLMKTVDEWLQKH